MGECRVVEAATEAEAIARAASEIVSEMDADADSRGGSPKERLPGKAGRAIEGGKADAREDDGDEG